MSKVFRRKERGGFGWGLQPYNIILGSHSNTLLGPRVSRKTISGDSQAVTGSRTQWKSGQRLTELRPWWGNRVKLGLIQNLSLRTTEGQQA